jgi:two-component system CheB/CheR fusion protein
LPRKKRPKSRKGGRFLIVGMGASAGGLEAFEKFFARMPGGSGMAFVLVPHLDAHHKSAMTEIIQRHTSMPVTEIRTGMAIAPDQVYVIPPGGVLTLRKARFQLAERVGPVAVIDTFLRSLAEDQADCAVGIILSGTGSDGSLGVTALKENGGLVLAQAPANSRFGSMPNHAVSTGSVDMVLPVEDMPGKLREYAENLSRIRQQVGRSRSEELRRNVVKIYTILRTATGHDFSHYKDSTFLRRVQRRMQVLQVAELGAYVEALRQQPREVELLFADLLIGVTHFFRDPRAFELIEREVLPKLIAEKSADDTIRIWVPGCATGEEAYSLAILVREQLARQKKPLKVQIFATDIDEQALETARAGLFPETIAKDVPPERLERFFLSTDKSYRIAKEIREMCIFSGHNITRDAPFSRLDLISCRNLLIYLDSSLQDRVLRLFHFALRHGGYLLLGPSENVTQHAKLFTRIHPRLRIFRARPGPPDRRIMDLPLGDNLGAVGAAGEKRRDATESGETLGRRALRAIEPYTPAYVVVDDHWDVLHFHGRTGRFLQPSPGAASLNLFNILEATLRPAVREALQLVASGRSKSIEQNVTVEDDGHRINLIVKPLLGTESQTRFFLVAFQDHGKAKPRPVRGRKGAGDTQRDEAIEGLEAELLATRERLQATIEELQTSNEEMKASNEEFQSVNEELQSSNEELETSKEELQSINEELETVNTELNAKIEALERATNDRKNLLESTQIAAVFLDQELRIRSFTPAVTEVFHLIEPDYGRSITDIAMRIRYTTLDRDVRHVMRTLEKVEHELEGENGGWYLMRVLPYRTVDNVIDGVVLTFLDISERKQHEEGLARLASIVSTSHDAIVGITTEGIITTWNAGAERLYGYEAGEMVGQSFAALLPPGRADELNEITAKTKRLGTVISIDTERLTRGGKLIPVASVISPIRDRNGRLAGASAIERDIRERRAADRQQAMLVAELNHRVKNVMANVVSIAARTAREGGSLPEYTAALNGRLRALARTHEVLSAASWAGADLADIVDAEMAPVRGGTERVHIAGESVMLKAGAAIVLGMTFHELATNAAKHGALVGDGNVDVRWKKNASHLRVDWKEAGGPPAQEPARRGFGLDFLERAVRHELQGNIDLQFRREGFQATLRLPLTEVAAGEEMSAAAGHVDGG